MFRDVPECFGMLRDVLECSMFRILSTAFPEQFPMQILAKSIAPQDTMFPFHNWENNNLTIIWRITDCYRSYGFHVVFNT